MNYVGIRKKGTGASKTQVAQKKRLGGKVSEKTNKEEKHRV